MIELPHTEFHRDHLMVRNQATMSWQPCVIKQENPDGSVIVYTEKDEQGKHEWRDTGKTYIDPRGIETPVMERVDFEASGWGGEDILILPPPPPDENALTFAVHEAVKVTPVFGG